MVLVVNNSEHLWSDDTAIARVGDRTYRLAVRRQVGRERRPNLGGTDQVGQPCEDFIGRTEAKSSGPGQCKRLADLASPEIDVDQSLAGRCKPGKSRRRLTCKGDAGGSGPCRLIHG